jgi:uroporphyrinogen-III synthase
VAHASFNGLRVLSLESRRAKEIEKLIRTYGGEPTVVPAMREVGIESNPEALDFVSRLMDGYFDLVIFTTGVGVRGLLDIALTRVDRESFLAALRKAKIVARSVKPAAVLRELQVPVDIVAEEPGTWHELLQAVETGYGESLSGMRIAVQEYGASNPEMLAALSERTRELTKVPVYRWALPEDLQPLRDCVRGLVNGMADIVLFMTAVQVIHLFQIAEEMKLAPELLQALRSAVVLSIGPSTSEELVQRGIVPDFEPSHPKMGFLVNEAAQCVHGLLEKKRNLTAAN